MVIAIGITDETLLPARLQSNNGLDITFQTLDEVSRGATYGPLDLVPSPAGTFTLTLANGVVCAATVSILAAMPTPAATPTPLPTNTPMPIPTLAPIGSSPTPTPTATPASLPEGGGGEEENQPPKSPLDWLSDLLDILLGG